MRQLATGKRKMQYPKIQNLKLKYYWPNRGA